MTLAQFGFLVVVFAVVAGITLAAPFLFGQGSLRARLQRFLGRPEPGPLEQQQGWIEKVARAAAPFTRLSIPEEGWERSPLRTRFMNAGWRLRYAPPLFFGAKTVLALLLPALAAPLAIGASRTGHGRGLLVLLLAAAALGYYLPNVVLARAAARRRREIFEHIPDALDLLTVCVEAGLSLERALLKVAAEIHIKSVVLAQELQLVIMEMRAGFTKEKALRNFALRSGVEDVDTLVAMLVQSERFGTSMGDSLRIHSDNLRTRRRMLAEEAAAKISLKLMFPLVFCIFPTLLMVLLGPAFLDITRMLGPGLHAAH
jgi:tight adherence protein C